MKLTDIVVVYCSNYNGCSLMVGDEEGREVDEFPEFREQCQQSVEDICDYAYDFCNEDGEFDGNRRDLKAFCVETVKRYFGEDVSVDVDIDDDSN